MNELIFIILGVTGDLARRKLIPALYKLVNDKQVDNYVIVGIGLENTSVEQIVQASKPYIDSVATVPFNNFAKHFFYQQADFLNKDDFHTLKQLIDQIEQQFDIHNKLIYLACHAQFFCPITTSLIEFGIVHNQSLSQEPWCRIVYEKPFGSDRSTAHEINRCIKEGLDESQVFRIDHYLAKELVGNIAILRFTNRIFEPLWNNHHIDQVQIILSEDIDMQGRGLFYDQYGALKDVVQNHMLQMLALITMEAPMKLSGTYIRDEKAKVLQCVQAVDGILGQYEGYRNEKGVQANSTTETFAALQVVVNNMRWSGVPFYLKTGKALSTKETIIYIRFKMVDCLLAKACPSEPNHLIMRLYPNSTFSIEINVKKPGEFDQVVPIDLAFARDLYGPATQAAYELLFQEIIKGDQSNSVRFDEIEHAWQVIDTFKQMKLPLYEYKKGTTGPEQAEEYASVHNFRWYR